MKDENLDKAGREVTEQVLESLQLLKKCREDKNKALYASYLHGQIYGLATALRIIFPGSLNWGEKAALAVREVITEHKCECQDHENH